MKIKTFQKILNCATSLFAQHGYDGTIMDDLAEKCGVNKASIYYHHKDKATLYENALTALFSPIADDVLAAVAAEAGPVNKLKAHIRTFAFANADNPDFAAILMREMASGGVNMPVRAREQMQRVFFRLKDTLAEGEAEKIFKSSDPLIIHFMIVGTINLFVASAPLRNALPKTKQYEQVRHSDIEVAAEQLNETIVDSLLMK